jgi:hypothetical protein
VIYFGWGDTYLVSTQKISNKRVIKGHPLPDKGKLLLKESLAHVAEGERTQVPYSHSGKWLICNR